MDFLGAAGELGDQSGLAAAGLAGDEATLALAGEGCIKELVQLGELALAGDEDASFGCHSLFPSPIRSYSMAPVMSTGTITS